MNMFWGLDQRTAFFEIFHLPLIGLLGSMAFREVWKLADVLCGRPAKSPAALTRLWVLTTCTRCGAGCWSSLEWECGGVWLKAKLLRPPSQRSWIRNASVGPAINIFQKSFSDVTVGVGILCVWGHCSELGGYLLDVFDVKQIASTSHLQYSQTIINNGSKCWMNM